MSDPAEPERERRSFVFRLMINPLTVPALGGALLAAVAVGIHLGESSIGLINPIYFQGPAIHPKDRGAAIDEAALQAPRPARYDQLYGWEEGQVARAADCGDCEALRARDTYARDYSARVPYFGGETEPRRYASAEPEAEPAVYYEAAAPYAEEVIEPEPPALRYAHYPVSYEEAAAEPEPDAYPDKFVKE